MSEVVEAHLVLNVFQFSCPFLGTYDKTCCFTFFGSFNIIFPAYFCAQDLVYLIWLSNFTTATALHDRLSLPARSDF